MRQIGAVIGVACVAALRLGAQEVPLSSLARPRLTTGVDTLQMYIQPATGAATLQKQYYVRSLTGSATEGWELTLTWYDSTGKRDAVQTSRTLPGSLELWQQLVRATTDSASLLIAAGTASGWVVPARGTARLFEGVGILPRYSGEMMEFALGASGPAVGQFVVAPIGNLFGPDPLAVSMDTLRITGTAEITVGTTRTPVWIIAHRNGALSYIGQRDHKVLARRGKAGPNAFWWHALPGVVLPISGS